MSWVWVFGDIFHSISFGSICHVRIFISRSHCLGINMVYNGIDMSNNLGIQRFSHFEIPTDDQYLNGTTNLIPLGGSLDSALMV